MVRTLTRLITNVVLIGMAAVILLATVPVQSQASLVVTKLDDTNDGNCDVSDCSLREAIASAPAGAIITFAPGLSGTIVVGSELFIDTDLAIDGPGASVITVSGNDAVRVFHSTAVVSISGLTVAHGYINFDAGGGIFNDQSTLTLNNMVLSQNDSFGGGSAVLSYIATTRISNSLIIGNNSNSGAAGIYQNVGTLIVENTTFSNNHSEGTGAGIFVRGGEVRISGSTFVNNSTPYNGAGIDFYGESLVIANSTFFGNVAGMGGGAGIYSSGNALVVNSTFSNNRNLDGFQGSAIFFLDGNFTLKNSIIADNIAARSCTGGVTDGGNNLQYPDDTCVDTIPVANPLLDPLASNGGPTQTMALQPGSPAIDAGNNATCGAAPVNNVDQRGSVRPVDGNGDGNPVCDIGAYEAPFTAPTNHSPVCSAAVPSRSSIWPPNHKMVIINILNVTDPDSDPITIAITSIFQDETVSPGGDGQGIGTPAAWVRAERAGSGNGRVYHISFSASDNHGGHCSGQVLVSIPHSSGGTAVDNGALYNSTLP
jgi:CSLREA domain-containing protein